MRIITTAERSAQILRDREENAPPNYDDVFTPAALRKARLTVGQVRELLKVSP